MKKRLVVAINPLVSLLSGSIECAINSHYKAKDIAARVIEASLQNQSLEAMYKLTQCLSADRVLEKMHAILKEEIQRLMRKSNKKVKLPKRVQIAMDFTEKQWYGNQHTLDSIGSKGGKQVRRYLELSSVAPALFLNALLVNQLNNNKLCLVEQLLDDFKQNYRKTKIELLLIDRGFFTKAVVKLLAERRIPFILPAVKNKAIKKLIEQYEQGEIPGKIKYQFGETWVHLLFLKVDDKVLVYMTNTSKIRLQVHRCYSKRWQIETNFREQNQFSLKTKSTDFTLRYLVFVIAGLLFNAWQMRRLSECIESYLFKQEVLRDLRADYRNRVLSIYEPPA